MHKLKLTVAIVALAILFWPHLIWHVVVIGILLTLIWRKLWEFASWKFWGVFTLIAFLPAMVFHSATAWYFSGLVFSRSLILYLALLLIADSVPLNTVNKYLPKILGVRLATIVTLAFNLLPAIRHIVIKNYALFYFRNKHGYNRCKFWGKYVLAVFRQIIAAAESCAENMLLVQQVQTPQVVIITGPRHSGKTTQLMHLVAKFKNYNWPVSGIVAPSLMEHNRRSTIFVTNVVTNEKHLLASRDLPIADLLYEYGGFNFSTKGCEFARQSLLNFHSRGIVVFDEYGPLEFADLGYAAEFVQLMQANVAAILVVVRDELLSRFIEKYQFLNYEVIHVPVGDLQEEVAAVQLTV